jgi:predicted ATPase
VELAPVRDPAGVVEAVAAVFHLGDRGGAPMEDAVVDLLIPKQLLLVLDNCEHLLSPIARLVSRIERSCPGVTVLATSREGIAIDGEQLLALPPLAAGDPGEDIERLVRTDAVALFVERARQAKSDFSLTPTNGLAVVEICQRLDGVPLAIELAAARVIALSPADIARRLDRRFQVLAGGRRGAVERHATLRAAIDWSYDLLTSGEQHLLARMAVFSGGCALEAVEEVCSGGPVDRDDVLDLVSGLVARSLVIAEEGVSGTRFRLLESIRQYGEARLAEWDETTWLIARHTSYYAALSQQAAESFYGPEQLVWARRINADRDNIRAALANAIEDGNAALAVQIVADYPHQRITESPTGEVLLIPASRVLDLPNAEQQPGFPRALVVAAYNAHAAGDFIAAEEMCQTALEAAKGLPAPRQGPRIEMDVCHLRAMASLAGGEYTDAASKFSHAAHLAVADGFPGLAALCLADGANSALLGGADVSEVRTMAEESVALARLSGMHGALVMSLNALALALAEDDPARARLLLNESIERCCTPGEEVSSGFLTASLVAGRLRDWDLTLALTVRTIQLWRSYLVALQTAPCLALLARALAESSPEVAGVLHGAAYTQFRHIGSTAETRRRPKSGRFDSRANFVHAAMREAGEIVAATLGAERSQELRTAGMAMSMEEANSYALREVDPKLLTGPIANIGP